MTTQADPKPKKPKKPEPDPRKELAVSEVTKLRDDSVISYQRCVPGSAARDSYARIVTALNYALEAVENS